MEESYFPNYDMLEQRLSKSVECFSGYTLVGYFYDPWFDSYGKERIVFLVLHLRLDVLHTYHYWLVVWNMFFFP